MTTAATTAPTKPKPGPETIRQAVLADQAAARAEVAAARRKTATKTEKVKTAKPTKAKTAKADARKITVLAKTNPHAAGSRRAGWFKQLKTGMTVEDAVNAGVRGIYLQRMHARGTIKIV